MKPHRLLPARSGWLPQIGCRASSTGRCARLSHARKHQWACAQLHTSNTEGDRHDFSPSAGVRAPGEHHHQGPGPHRHRLGLLADGASAAQAQSANLPDVQVGDRWYWQHTDALANIRDWTSIDQVIAVDDKTIKVRGQIKGKPGYAVHTFARDWSPIDVGVAKYDPPLQILSFPLTVGKKWSQSGDKQVLSNGKHGSYNLRGEVQAFEKVTTPAGTFDAYKVVLTIDATSNDEDANVGHTTDTEWYAPALKRYVKSINAFTRDGVERSRDLLELSDSSLR